MDKERRKRRRETQIERATNKEGTREDEMREISERIATMIAGRQRGEAEIGKRPEGENDHCSGDERVGS